MMRLFHLFICFICLYFREAGRRVPHKTIADFSLTFYQNESAKVVTNKIFSTVKNGKLDEMPVYPQTLKIKGMYIMINLLQKEYCDQSVTSYFMEQCNQSFTLSE